MNMKKFDNFSKCLNELKKVDFKKVNEDEIYKIGIIGLFNITFELAWKALQTILRLHGFQEATAGSPREILQLAYKINFIDNSEIWLMMLKKRNVVAHVYSESEVDELVLLIRDKFICAFVDLEKTLKIKFENIEQLSQNVHDKSANQRI